MEKRFLYLFLGLFSLNLYSIIGGTLTNHPAVKSIHIVYTEEYDGESVFKWNYCSGVFISPSHYLTASHCILNRLMEDDISKFQEGTLVMIDSPHIDNSGEVEEIVMAIENDVAVIKFRSVISESFVEIESKESINSISAGDEFEVYGFGHRFLPKKSQERVKLINHSYEDLEDIYSSFNRFVETENILIKEKAEFSVSFVDYILAPVLDSSELVKNLLIISGDPEGLDSPFISFGDSGGPVLNKNGKVVAVQSRIIGCNESDRILSSSGEKKLIKYFGSIGDYILCTLDNELHAEAALISTDPDFYNYLSNI